MRKFFWIALLAWNCTVAVALLRTEEALQLHVLDVGQGDALLVTTPEQNHILVDGGPDSSVLGELGGVLPLFFREIDLMVLTHPHADHVDGLIPVLERFRVRAVLMSAPDYPSDDFEAFLREVTRQKIPVYMAEATQDFTLGTTTIDLLHPFRPTTAKHFVDINNASVVLKISQGGHSMLLTGDAEKEVEAALLAAEVDLKAELLKAGHHGSSSSTTLSFVQAVAPQLMVISCGKGNTYGHPHRETLRTAAALKLPVLRTDTLGRLSLIFDEHPEGFQSWLRSILAPNWRSFSSSLSYPRSI